MKKFLFFICFIAFSFAAFSQGQTTLQISGKITDSVTKKPIALAILFLKNDKKVQLKSAISANDGSFLIGGLSSGNYYLRVTFIDHQSKEIEVSLTSTSKVIENISLLPTAATQLKGITVTGERPLIKQEIDRISYDVKADPENKVNNVLEMMRKVPLLAVDGDDNIQLQGNSNYKILINGKPSGMMERNPKDILKSMPAANIEKIEVITTPPAKYDGEGLAGLINIITNKKVDNGSNGSINVNQRFPVGGPGLGGSFTLKSGKFGISTNVGGNLNSSPLLNNSNLRLTQGNNPTNLWQTGSRDFSGKSGYSGVEMSFELDSLNLISAQLNYNANKNESLGTQYSTLKNTTSLLQSYELINTLEGSGSGVDAAFNYQLGFKKDKNRLLTFSYRYYDFSNDQFNQVDVFNPVAYSQPNYIQNNTGGSSEQTVQLDYVHPYKKLSIEAGIKAIFRNNFSNFDYSSANAIGQFVLDLSRTNGFDNEQDVYSFYNSYQLNLKNWGFKGGIRVEQTEIDAVFSTTSTLSQSSLNFIPSISINRKFKDMSSLNFGFTSRIQRPGINQLNPFIDRSNPNFESSGNPDLKPMVGQSLQLNYSTFKKISLNMGLRGMFVNNLIMPRVVTDPTTNITRTSFGNTGKASVIGATLTINYPFTNKLKFNISGMAGYGRVKGEVNGVLLRKEGLMRNAFTSLTYRSTKAWQATASANYNGPNLTLQGTSNTFVSTSFSVNKDFLNNKLSLSFAANNAFNKYREAINYTNGPNFTQESYNQNYQRNFTASLNYRFGKLKDSIKKNKKGIVNNDVSSGSNL